jgi:lipid A biosynthesis acyltransferase
LLGLKHKVPLVLAYAVFEDNIIKVVNKKILEIEKKENLKATVKFNMQKIFHEFEEIIREYPEQYMWQHKRWREE